MSPRGTAPSPWDRPSESSRDSFTPMSCSYRASTGFAPPNSMDSRQEYVNTSSSAFPPPQNQYLNNNSPSSYGSHSLDSRDSRSSSRMSAAFTGPSRTSTGWSDMGRPTSGPYPPTSGQSDVLGFESRKRTPPDAYSMGMDDSMSYTLSETNGESHSGRPRTQSKAHPQRRPANRDEFDGPHQFLDKPSIEPMEATERDLPHLSTNLFVNEQDDILSKVNDCLSRCAFDFIAKYQFPVPLEADKRPVRVPADREWTEWVFLLKRLATKRRIPARVLYNGQIKQLVTVLENSLEMRHAAKHQSRPQKDDRNVLQLISAGLQVAKILKDAAAMDFLDRLYVQIEHLIQHRRRNPSLPGYM